MDFLKNMILRNMKTNKEIIDNIKNLYIQWYKTSIFDSRCLAGLNEHHELIEYSQQYIPEFKIAMMELLEHPNEMNYHIPTVCCYMLKKVFIELYENKKDKLPLEEDYLWNECNLWLNHFKKTKDIDYYAKFKAYKKYLTENFKPYNPFTGKDPNLTYEEYCKKCDDIDVVNKFTTELRKKNNIKLVWNTQEKK